MRALPSCVRVAPNRTAFNPETPAEGLTYYPLSGVFRRLSCRLARGRFGQSVLRPVGLRL